MADVDYSDAAYSYEGEQSDSVFSLDYYRNKAREFQAVLNNVDAAARAARIAIEADIDPELTQGLVEDLQEFDSKKLTFRLTAEGINAAAALINSAGGRFPALSIPAGLGALPVIPAAGIAAIGVAATLIAWGVKWIDGVNQRLSNAQYLAKGTPQQQAELARALAISDASQRASSESPLASIAGAVKWGAIGLVAFLAYQAWQRSSSR